MLPSSIKRIRLFRIVKTLSHGERIVFAGAAVVFAVSAVIYGALLLQTKTYLIGAEGGTFKEGIVGQPVFINPVIPSTDADRDISRIVFSSVVDVADSVKRSDNGMEWNVRLKENVFWHDGVRLTADDIIFTLNVIQDPESRSPLQTSFQGVTAERVSELEVKFSLQNKYAFFESDHLSNMRVIPKHIFADIPVQNMKLSSLGLRPIGSGPYKISGFDRNGDGLVEKIELAANEAYFNGAPLIEKLVFKFYKNDSELVRSYNLGQIDGFGLSIAEPLGEDRVHIRHETHNLKTSRYYAIFINQSVGPKELKNVKVREALSAAVDRDRIVRDVLHSYGRPVFAPTVLSEDPVTNPDFSLLKGLEIEIVVPEEDFLVKTADIVKENWEAHGAKVSLSVLPVRAIQSDILRNSDYGAILFGNITKQNYDLFAFWHSSRRFYPDQNLSLYQNKDVDRLLENYRKNFNTDERQEELAAISKKIAGDVPAIFLYAPDYIYTAAPRLGGFQNSVVINTADDRFTGIEKWHLNTKRVFKKPDVQ